MFLGRVIGTCVATQKVAGWRACVSSWWSRGSVGQDVGRALRGGDTVNAGRARSSTGSARARASLALEEAFVPVDAAIIGLVDEIDRPGARGFLRGRDDLRTP